MGDGITNDYTINDFIWNPITENVYFGGKGYTG